MYIGDYAEDYATLNHKFTTRALTGVPTQFAGSPVLSIYKGSATGTEKTSAEAYITLGVDFDGITGLNNVLIDLSGDVFFETGEDYAAVITTGTVDGVSVVGEAVFEFSIENRFTRGTDSAALASVCTEGRLAELDDANLPTDIAAIPTTAMRGTDSAALASVATEARLAELDAANMPADIDAIPTTAMRGTDSAALASVATEARLAELDGANLPTDIDAILADTGTDGVVLSAAQMQAIANHIINRGAAGARASGDGDSPSFRSLGGAMAKLINRVEVEENTLTVYEEDDNTALGTQTTTDDASADPITGVNTD